MDSASNSSGFSNHVMGQLNEMSHQASTRGRWHRGGPRGQGQDRGNFARSQPDQHRRAPFNLSQDSFPALGSNPPASSSVDPGLALPQHQQTWQPMNFQQESRHGTPREYQERARGYHRGVRHFSDRPHHSRQALQQFQPDIPTGAHADARPPPRHNQLYNPNANMHYGTVQQQREARHMVMRQADYLTGIAKGAYDEYRFTKEEKDVKENFRHSLETLARTALAAKYPELDVALVRLKCYGSLANGFALKNCDMDLLLALPEHDKPENDRAPATVTTDGEQSAPSNGDDDKAGHGFMADVQRILEKAFLDNEYGARLLTQTRVPILRICQAPNAELLENLRKNRADWEQSTEHGGAAEEVSKESEDISADLETVKEAMTDLTLATKPTSGRRAGRGNAGLEFTNDCGIQCDINFSNFVALHNSNLLRLYHGFDSRVMEVGIFVKIWAKLRDINTPYRGTLSSYGWVLMVLHYLMNVANPPVIPNLQYLAKTGDSWNPDKPIELFDGFDVRFIQDPQSLQDIQRDMATNKNRESAGQLLRGFFQYYAINQGFHWTRDIISLRTKGGILQKQVKGWTEAKWQGQAKTVRNRYLIAIEDPFEVEHNIARTVGHHGIVTIRDEFRRAWNMIQKCGTPEQIPADEFLRPVLDKVDTHRQDQDAYKQRQVQMRKDIEAREKAMLEQAHTESVEPPIDGMWGESDEQKMKTSSRAEGNLAPSEPKLTSRIPTQVRKQSNTPQSWRRRKVTIESDDEDEPNDDSKKAQQHDENTTEPKSKVESKPNGGLTSREEVLFANGFDVAGNPVAWDIDTQEGRWLHWRDQKMRNGGVGPFLHEDLRALDEQCPFDERRPSPYIGKPYRHIGERMQYERPPWPANKTDEVNSQKDELRPSEQDRVPQAVPHITESQLLTKIPVIPENEVPTLPQVCGESSDAAGQCKNLPATSAAPQAGMGRVGPFIPWDITTHEGRWLRWRDKWIMEGTFKMPPSRSYRKIHQAFPYEPQMTWAELDEMNELLRSHDRSTVRFWKKPPNVAAAQELSMDRRDERASSFGVVNHASEDQDKSPDQGRLAEAVALTPPYGLSSTLSNASQGEALAHVMTGSDMQPSQETLSDKGPATPLDNNRTPDAHFLRLQRLAFFTKQLPTSKSEVDTNDQFYAQGVQSRLVDVACQDFPTPVISQSVPIPRHGAERSSVPTATAQSRCGDDNTSEQPEQKGQDFSDLAVKTSDSPIKDDLNVRVPATLYREEDLSRRPRDEDPNIMPIPRTFGFQFDPRQLQDLAIISKGGNGCAREGAEFNIEADGYEWGGGGMMGYRSSTGPQIGGPSTHTPYEAGQGDQEGLLDELPQL